MTKWKPIETVPYDGKPVLVYLESEMLKSRIHTATYHKNITIIGAHFDFDCPKATHWMPLPIAPEEGGDD